MRKTILILFLSISVHTLYSQQDSLLRNFKFRINHYRAINFNMGGAAQVSNNKLVTGTVKNNSSGANLGANYYSIKSTDRILLRTSGALSPGFSSARSESPDNINKNRSFSAMSQFSILNKWFHKNRFTELGADISGNHYVSKSTFSTQQGSGKHYQNSYSAAINMGVGKGRLENITDMQNALWLYKTLQEENRLSRSFSAEELNELGRTITMANNTRVLDFRKRAQFMLETTDKFFQQKNILSSADIRYFSSLNDILFYAFNNQRLSGIEKYIRLTPSITNSRNGQNNHSTVEKYRHRSTNKSILLSTGINKYVPVNLRHQNNYGFSAKLNYISHGETDKYFASGSVVNQYERNTTIKQAGINLFFQHAIYPNTRTAIHFDLRSETGYQDAGYEDGFFGMANLSASLNYFISYRTRFTASITTAYQKKIYNYSYYDQLQLLPDNIQLFANAGLEINL